MTIADRAAALRARLPPGVTLVAVSKTQPAEAVREAYAAGLRDFGENYAQEWKAKADALADLPDLRWHFVGSLQTNKVKTLVGRVGGGAGIAYVHAVDREDLARELSRRFAPAGRVVRVFLEVNTGGEASKGGCAPAEAPRLAAAVKELPGVELIGLMCIPPPDQDPRPHFRALRDLRDRLGLAQLSMGMSGDWETAVAEGATFVRIGTALFGERPPRR